MQRWRGWLGWVAVGLSTAITALWAFWGIVENFHEGWYLGSLPADLGLALAQYLSPMLLFMGAALLALRWPRWGGALHLAIATAALAFFRPWTPAVVTMIAVPLVLLAVLHAIGRPRPRRLAVALAVGIPLATLVACGIGPAIRVAGRLDDGIRGALTVTGNAVRLTWAPTGPGWPTEGVSWAEATRRCRHLTADGRALADTTLDLWRLPTADEVVRSQSRHGANCGGVLDPVAGKATYRVRPDKETPLWDPRSKVIYWWTGTEVDSARALIMVYDGQLWPRRKRWQAGYLAFRAVRSEVNPGGPAADTSGDHPNTEGANRR